MDSPAPSHVSRLVGILRKMTRVVQIAPFAYLLALSLYLLLEGIAPGQLTGLADNVLEAPVSVTLGMLYFGRILKLCRWFRVACLLPAAPKIVGYIDSYLLTFTQGEISVINISLSILFSIFLIRAVHYFFNGFKKIPARVA